MGRAEPGDHLGLALEASGRLVGHTRRGGADQLDGGGAGQHAVPGAPHFAHPSLAQLLLELVAPQLARAAHLGAEVVDHPGAHPGHAGHEQVGEDQPEEEERRGDPQRGRAYGDQQPDDDRHRADRGQCGQQRAAGGGRHDDGEQHHPDRDPGQSQISPVFLEPAGIAELGGGDGIAAHDLEDEPEQSSRGPARRAGSPPRAAIATTMPITPGAHWTTFAQEAGPLGGNDQRREDPRQEEDQRVEQGQDLEAGRGQAEQIGWQAGRRRRGRRDRCPRR